MLDEDVCRQILGALMPSFVKNDGGRAAAGFKGEAGDCVVRAIAIATGIPYREVYDELHRRVKARRKVYRGKRKKFKSPRNGVHREIFQPYLEERGWVWTPTMRVGSGCRVHLNADELPKGRLIVSVSKHVCAVIDGVVHDTYDPGRDGGRCVYGYFALDESAPCLNCDGTGAECPACNGSGKHADVVRAVAEGNSK